MTQGSSVRAPSATPIALTEDRWQSAQTLADYVSGEIENAELWRTTTRLARLDDAQTARAAALTEPSRMLVLLEDWCGDAMYTVPFAQRIAEANPRLALRVLPREGNDDLMDAHLTGLSRSIPVLIRFGADGVERGWWGPRPTPLQHWVLSEGVLLSKPERYKGVRTWYARDRGATTADEILQLLRS